MKKVILIAIVLLTAIAFVNAQTKPKLKENATKNIDKGKATTKPGPMKPEAGGIAQQKLDNKPNIKQGTEKKEPEKQYLFKLTDEQIGGLWAILIFSQQNLPTSDAKASDVSKAIKQISSYQQLIQEQLKPQVDTIKTPAPVVTAKDTTKKTDINIKKVGQLNEY